MTTTTTATQNEIARLAYKLKWTTAVQYRKHISTEASFEENLLSLLRIADDDRERTLVKRRLKAASFPIQKTLDTFRFDPAGLPNLKQEQILAARADDGHHLIAGHVMALGDVVHGRDAGAAADADDRAVQLVDFGRLAQRADHILKALSRL